MHIEIVIIQTIYITRPNKMVVTNMQLILYDLLINIRFRAPIETH